MQQVFEQFTDMTRWAHAMLTPALEPGALAVDLTAGNGFDTLFLWRAVGSAGTVLAFDIQAQALSETRRRLDAAGARTVRLADAECLPADTPGVFLACACHALLPRLLRRAPQAVMANLGYLPGGDHAVITRSETTLQALHAALTLLAVGGRLAVAAYPGHPGGDQESRAVRELFATLDARQWLVLELSASNRPRAPRLLLAEKRVASSCGRAVAGAAL